MLFITSFIELLCQESEADISHTDNWATPVCTASLLEENTFKQILKVRDEFSTWGRGC